METTVIRTLVRLGVPGVALAVFYLLLRAFNFQFSQVSPEWTVTVVLLFLLIVAGVTSYALHLWAPVKQPVMREKHPSLPKSENHKTITFNVAEENVILTELLRTLPYDFIKVNAHTHEVGIVAEYEWINRAYPNNKWLGQSLVNIPVKGDLYFDCVKIKLPDGREKDIYFDISSFFGGKTSLLLDPHNDIAKKIKELYS